jgi:hypothetical protein|eukprot:6748523-Prymnesium_polylepis.1
MANGSAPFWRYCGFDAIVPPAAPPPAAPLDEDAFDGWVIVGVVMAEIAIAMLTLGTNVQRFGLAVVAQRGCCGRMRLFCCSCSNFVWLFGWLIYVSGNGVFFVAVSLACDTASRSHDP